MFVRHRVKTLQAAATSWWWCVLLLAVVPSSRGTGQQLGAQQRLWAAAQLGDTGEALASIAAGARVDSVDTQISRNGRRALNYAALGNHVPVIRMLLERGAQVNLTNRSGFTPLHHAAEGGSIAAARALLAAGADAMAKARGGVTARRIANEKGFTALEAVLDSAERRARQRRP